MFFPPCFPACSVGVVSVDGHVSLVFRPSLSIVCNGCGASCGPCGTRVPSAHAFAHHNVLFIRQVAASGGWRHVHPNDDFCPMCASSVVQKICCNGCGAFYGQCGARVSSDMALVHTDVRVVRQAAAQDGWFHVAPNDDFCPLCSSIAVVETNRIENNVGDRLMEGLCACSDADYRLAEELFAADWDSADARNNLGVLAEFGLGRQVNLQEAFHHYKAALKLDANFAPAFRNIGCILLKLGHRDTAARALQVARTLNDPLASYYLGCLAFERVIIDDPVPYLQTANLQGVAEAASLLGVVYERQGDDRKAEWVYQSSADPISLHNLALLGQRWGSPPDEVDRLFRSAAEQGVAREESPIIRSTAEIRDLAATRRYGDVYKARTGIESLSLAGKSVDHLFELQIAKFLANSAAERGVSVDKSVVNHLFNSNPNFRVKSQAGNLKKKAAVASGLRKYHSGLPLSSLERKHFLTGVGAWDKLDTKKMDKDTRSEFQSFVDHVRREPHDRAAGEVLGTRYLSHKDDGHISASSSAIKSGKIRLNADNTIDKRSADVQSGYVRVRNDGQLDGRSQAAHDLRAGLGTQFRFDNANVVSTVDRRSSAVQSGGMLFTGAGQIDHRSALVRNGDILIRQDGQIDGRSRAVRDGRVKRK